MIFPPEQIYTEDLTHVNFAFAYISKYVWLLLLHDHMDFILRASSFQVVEATLGDSQLWQRTTNLKGKNPALKVFLSIGESNCHANPELELSSFERWLEL